MNSFKNVITVLNLRKFAPISHQKQSAGGLLKNKKHKSTVWLAKRDACLLERGDGVSIAEARQAGRDEVTQNPSLYSLITRAAYNEVVTERDERITFGEVKDARLGSVVLLPDVENNRVKIRFSIEETDDFRTWTKRDEINEVFVPLEASKRFYRFSLENE
jgi:hypothetical protein